MRRTKALPGVTNLVTSSVPGPTMLRSMAGARRVTNLPASIVMHGVALNVTVQTCDDALDIGLMACADALPEVREVAANLLSAFDELRSLVPRVIAPT